MFKNMQIRNCLIRTFIDTGTGILIRVDILIFSEFRKLSPIKSKRYKRREYVLTNCNKTLFTKIKNTKTTYKKHVCLLLSPLEFYDSCIAALHPDCVLDFFREHRALILLCSRHRNYFDAFES